MRRRDESELGTKTEIKNMNTLKGVVNALTFEIQRQIDTLDAGEVIRQETRRWDVDSGTTQSMRFKEDAHDYRYFPEPDLMPVVLDGSTVASWREALPELPRVRQARFSEQYGLPGYDAKVLVADRVLADFFEEAAGFSPNYKELSNWIMTEILRTLSETGKGIGDIPVTAKALADLVDMVHNGTVNATIAKQVLTVLVADGGDPVDIVEKNGLAQVSDQRAIKVFVDQVISENAKSVQDYAAGKGAAIQFLMGQVMRLSGGKADPQTVLGLLKERLD